MRKKSMTEAEKLEERQNNIEILQNIEQSTYRKSGVYTLKYPLCIITCHDRRPSILENLYQFSDETTINVFIYEDELKLYDWLHKKRLNKIIVPIKYRSCQKMRVFVQQYMGVKKYWVTDDDLRAVALYDDKREISIGHALRMLEELSEGKFYSAIGYGHVDIATKFWVGKLTLDTYASVTLLYDGEILTKNRLKYTGDSEVDESLEFIINSHLKGVPVKNCPWGLLRCYEPSGGKNSLASPPEKHLSMQEALYIKYGDYVRLGLEKRRGYTAHIRYTQLGKKKSYDTELLRLCKAGDHDGVLNYLKEKRNISDTEEKNEEL